MRGKPKDEMKAEEKPAEQREEEVLFAHCLKLSPVSDGYRRQKQAGEDEAPEGDYGRKRVSHAGEKGGKGYPRYAQGQDQVGVEHRLRLSFHGLSS